MTVYEFKEIEKKWQKKWVDEGVYTPNVLQAQNPFYNLWMFPYPSAEGLHAGHAFASTGSDVFGRFKRMHGYQVMQPMGFDSFGIHSENFALKIGEHPSKMLARTTKNFKRQLDSLGHGYDWNHSVTTSDPEYYQWTQWLFVQLFKAGLAYRRKANVNWCPSCKTVLADEQVIDGECERCQSVAEKKELMQWFFKITDYADRLLDNLDKINWTEKIKTAQRNWIGRSHGYSIKFAMADSKSAGEIEVFTTRPDTLHGATFLALAVNHPEVIKGINTEKDPILSAFVQKVTDEKLMEFKEKIGMFTGKYAVNPVTGQNMPIWVTNYVTMDYGTGAIMGVPAHDERDREFATKYQIDIFEMEPDSSLAEKIEKSGWGKPVTNYHLRDWLISRQRYWGPPIPMIHCQGCEEKGEGERSEMPGWYTVPESELPVLLPDLKDYQPDGSGRGPLAKHPEFYETVCPKCKEKAMRETDVSDTFLDSAWYFLRYPSVGAPSASKLPYDDAITKKWLPVSLYFGGAEHAVLHLMYSRFITMVLYDLKKLDFEEPFPEFYAHGLMIKDGAKMSKSRGNVVNPDQYVEKFGADAFRLYLLFIGPMDGSPDFRDSGMEGMARFVNRLWKIYTNPRLTKDDKEVEIKLHSTIKRVTQDVENKRFNTAIAAVMELVNSIEKAGGGLSESGMDTLAKILAPFAPHLAEEMYSRHEDAGKFISVHTQDWPQYDEGLIADKQATIVVQVNGIMRDRLVVPANYMNDEEYVQQQAQASAKVVNYINGAQFRSIFVPGKIINFVTR